MKRWTCSSACCLALLIGGCPKRQSGPRLVYVPTPPAASPARPASGSGTLIIEEPVETQPPVTQALPAPPPAQQPTQSKTRARSTGKAPASVEPSAETPADEPLKPPALEPAESSGQASLRQKVEKTQGNLRLRVAQFENRSLSDAERRTLNEARSFLAQSVRALKEGDLQRADNLAHKSEVLVTALEKGP